MLEIKHYLTGDDCDVFAEWRDELNDKTAKIAIDRRIFLVEQGNFGDHKPCREGVWDLRIDVGIVRRNPRKSCHPNFSPAMSSSKSRVLPSLWKV